MDEPAEIGRRIQHLRTQQGLTQRQLAAPEYTAAHVSTVESGKVRPSDAALRFYAAQLGTTYEELTTGRPAHAATELRGALADAQHLLATGTPQDAAVRFQELAAEAERLTLPPEAATARVGLGECALETGELDTARVHFEAAERLLAGEPLPRRARAIRGRAVAHLLAGELRYACYLLESALDALNSGGLHDPDALVLLYSASIGPYMDMGAHGRAAHAADIALALAPQVSDPALVASMHRNVARTLLAEGRIAEADRSLAKAQELYQQLHQRTELAHCHWMRGYVHAQHGSLEDAERELRTAHATLAAKHASLFTAQVEVELADVLRRRGRHEEAESLLTRLLARLPKSPPDREAARTRGGVHTAGAHRLLGLIAEDRGDLAAAEERYDNAFLLLSHSGAAGDLADICRLRGDLLRRTGRIEAAMDAYRTGLGHRAAPGTTTLGPAPERPAL